MCVIIVCKERSDEMSVYISTLTENDYEPSLEMIQDAYQDVDANAYERIQQLRLAPEYHYELEVIAKDEAGEIIGHALCTPIHIKSEQEAYHALMLASLSVKTSYRQMGLGKALVRALEERAQALEYTTMIVVGQQAYFEPLGYELASRHGITHANHALQTQTFVKFLWDTLESPPHGEIAYVSSDFD